jgi:hypothetical protein
MHKVGSGVVGKKICVIALGRRRILSVAAGFMIQAWPGWMTREDHRRGCSAVHAGRFYGTCCNLHVQRWKHFNPGIRRGVGLLAGDSIGIGHCERTSHGISEAPRLQVLYRRRLQEPLPGRIKFRQHIRPHHPTAFDGHSHDDLARYVRGLRDRGVHRQGSPLQDWNCRSCCRLDSLA